MRRFLFLLVFLLVACEASQFEPPSEASSCAGGTEIFDFYRRTFSAASFGTSSNFLDLASEASDAQNFGVSEVLFEYGTKGFDSGQLSELALVSLMSHAVDDLYPFYNGCSSLASDIASEGVFLSGLPLIGSFGEYHVSQADVPCVSSLSRYLSSDVAAGLVFLPNDKEFGLDLVLPSSDLVIAPSVSVAFLLCVSPVSLFAGVVSDGSLALSAPEGTDSSLFTACLSEFSPILVSESAGDVYSFVSGSVPSFQFLSGVVETCRDVR